MRRSYTVREKALTAAAALTLLVALAGVSRAAAGDMNPLTARIVNSTSEPIPTVAQGTTAVTGSVAITNMPAVAITNLPGVAITNVPSVQAQQSGAWNVGVVGTPTVNLGTGATVQLAPGATVRVAAETTVRFKCADPGPQGDGGGKTNCAPVVPAGKELVVDICYFTGKSEDKGLATVESGHALITVASPSQTTLTERSRASTVLAWDGDSIVTGKIEGPIVVEPSDWFSVFMEHRGSPKVNYPDGYMVYWDASCTGRLRDAAQ